MYLVVSNVMHILLNQNLHFDCLLAIEPLVTLIKFFILCHFFSYEELPRKCSRITLKINYRKFVIMFQRTILYLYFVLRTVSRICVFYCFICLPSFLNDILNMSFMVLWIAIYFSLKPTSKKRHWILNSEQ